MSKRAMSSVTRFGKISTLWQKIKKTYLAIGNFLEPFLDTNVLLKSIFYHCKRTDIEQIISPSVLLLSQSILYSSFSHCLASVFLLAPS